MKWLSAQLAEARRFFSFGAAHQLRVPYLVGGLVVMFAAFDAAWILTDPTTTLLVGLGLIGVVPGVTVWVQELVDYHFPRREHAQARDDHPGRDAQQRGRGRPGEPD